MRTTRVAVAAMLAALLFSARARAASPAPAPGPEFFAAHRAAFLAAMPEGSIAVFRAAPDVASEVGVLYRQSSDFWYLTGLSEPEAILVLRPSAPEGARYVLFVKPRDFAAEQWTGWRTGIEGAKSQFQADAAYPVEDFWKEIPKLWPGARMLLWSDGGDATFRGKLREAWEAPDAQSAELRPSADAGPLVHRLRLVKDATEQALLRRAAELSAEGHVAAMKAVRPGRYEYEVRAAMESVCTSGGALRTAYPSIVGSGPNSVILHYERDDRRMNAGETIVNDSACEYGMYAADVTRSYPVSGSFSPEQRAIYDLVLAAQKAGFAKIRPGAAFHDVHDATVDVIVDGLLRLGILHGDRAEVMKTRAYTAFYPHGSSHWLGMDVHDVGSYGFSNPDAPRLERYSLAQTRLEPGMAFTVEPGIYIREHAKDVDPKWWNIGVRIEDDVLVTASGMDCLSCSAPREAADVEKTIRGR
jgi:Xaa-Pro aminopeptidase